MRKAPLPLPLLVTALLVASFIAMAPGALPAQPLQPAPTIRSMRAVSFLMPPTGTATHLAAPVLASATDQYWRAHVAQSPLALSLASSDQPNSCRLTAKRRFVNPVLAVTAFALPVAGIAALISERKHRAATGAIIGGSLYAVGATIVLDRMASCSSTSGLIYIWTPVAATAGAVIATR